MVVRAFQKYIADQKDAQEIHKVTTVPEVVGFPISCLSPAG